MTEEKEKKMGLFDMLNEIQCEKRPWSEVPEDGQKAYAPFMVNRFVSSREQYIPIIEQISTLKLTTEQHYEIMRTLFNSQRKIFFDYKAYKKEKEDPDEALLLYAFTREYECGMREAKNNIGNISSEETMYLKKKWKDVFEASKAK